MASIWYSHFDSTPEDTRLLLAEDWAKYIRNFLGDGIKNGGTTLQVTTDGQGMHTYINKGYANIQGYFFVCEEDFEGSSYKLEHPSAASKARVDRIVLRLDRTISARNIMPTVITGEPGTEQPPALTRNSVVWEISLAQVRVAAGAATITPANIIDERLNSSVCGIIDSLIQADTEGIFNTFLEAFESERINIYTLFTRLSEETALTFQELIAYTNETVDSAVELWGDLVGQYKTDISKLQSFVFDNDFELPGTTKTIDFGTGTTTYESIVKNINGDYVAERVTDYTEKGTFLIRTKLFDEDGKTVLKDVVNETVFNLDGTISIIGRDTNLTRRSNILPLPSDENKNLAESLVVKE